MSASSDHKQPAIKVKKPSLEHRRATGPGIRQSEMLAVDASATDNPTTELSGKPAPSSASDRPAGGKLLTIFDQSQSATTPSELEYENVHQPYCCLIKLRTKQMLYLKFRLLLRL